MGKRFISYEPFRKEFREWLEGAKEKHPELAHFLEQDIIACLARELHGREKYKGHCSTEYLHSLIDKACGTAEKEAE